MPWQDLISLSQQQPDGSARGTVKSRKGNKYDVWFNKKTNYNGESVRKLQRLLSRGVDISVDVSFKNKYPEVLEVKVSWT